MTARARSAIAPVLVLLAAAALAYALSLIPTLGLAHGAPAGAAVQVAEVSLPPGDAPAAPVARPSDALHDPIDDLGGAIDDAAAAKRQGWPLGLLVGVVLVSRGLGTARRRWPGVSALRWMAGRAGLLTIGAGAVAAAAVDALALGGSWFAAAAAAIGAALALLDPGPRPTARTPERGSAAGPLLVILSCVPLVALAGLAWGCAGTGSAVKTAGADVVHCATAEASPLVDAIQADILASTRPDGTLDADALESKLLARIVELGRDVVACATRRAIERMLEPGLAPAPRGLSWERVRVEVFGGVEVR